VITLNGIDDIKARVGQDLGVSEWHEVTQEEINAFADVTGDHQWIHVDPERARETPFGGTIAHGFYTVALTPMLMQQLYTVTNVAFALNYGLDRVRFPAPLPVGSRVRASAQISSVDEIAGGIQMKTTITLERDGGDKPVCVAEQLVRIYGG
jgi:acyl dehydratase